MQDTFYTDKVENYVFNTFQVDTILEVTLVAFNEEGCTDTVKNTIKIIGNPNPGIELVLYPNPVNFYVENIVYVNIESDIRADAIGKIYDAAGREVMSGFFENLGNGLSQLRFKLPEGLTAGDYVVGIWIDGKLVPDKTSKSNFVEENNIPIPLIYRKFTLIK